MTTKTDWEIELRNTHAEIRSKLEQGANIASVLGFLLIALIGYGITLLGSDNFGPKLAGAGVLGALYFIGLAIYKLCLDIDAAPKGKRIAKVNETLGILFRGIIGTVYLVLKYALYVAGIIAAVYFSWPYLHFIAMGFFIAGGFWLFSRLLR